MSEHYYIGDKVRLVFTIEPLDGVVAVREEISLRIYRPDKTTVTVSNDDIVQAAPNQFYFDYKITQAKQHKYGFTSEGTVDAVEYGEFYVKESPF